MKKRIEYFIKGSLEDFIHYADLYCQEFYGLIEDGRYPTYDELVEYYKEYKERYKKSFWIDEGEDNGKKI